MNKIKLSIISFLVMTSCASNVNESASYSKNKIDHQVVLQEYLQLLEPGSVLNWNTYFVKTEKPNGVIGRLTLNRMENNFKNPGTYTELKNEVLNTLSSEKGQGLGLLLNNINKPSLEKENKNPRINDFIDKFSSVGNSCTILESTKASNNETVGVVKCVKDYQAARCNNTDLTFAIYDIESNILLKTSTNTVADCLS